jgi:thiamine pyrophosphokinase
MESERIRANVAVTLVGAGQVADATLAAALGLAPRLFAADGGAHRLAAAGLRPEAIVGDLDSLGPAGPWLDRGIPVHRIDEQETTDFAKCLRLIAAPLYLAVGFAGDRLDHLLATLSVMAAMPQKRVVVLGDGDLLFLAPPALTLDLAAGTRVSLWPLLATRVTRCEGLVWDALHLLLAPDGRTGTSNAARGGPVRLGFDRPGVFVVLPLADLPQVVRVLSTPAD